MLSLFILLASLSNAPPSDQLIAHQDATTSEVTLGNERIRLRFQPVKPAQFDIHPKGYAGYTVELADKDAWAPMATATYFTSFCYRCTWGRDWLNYVIPDTVTLHRDARSATAVFSRIQWDVDQGRWEFTFTFTVRPGSPIVDVTYSAVSNSPTKLLLMWGPRLCAGEGSFGADKDEALFPGLEYLGRNERSSANPALAPDAQKWFVPSPAKITIPLMSVLHAGKLVGIMWNPLRKWVNEETCPSAVFASPNWLDSKEHHLLGLFVPGVPKHVAENSLRAHTPVEVPAGAEIAISAQIFALPAQHAVDAVDLYLKEHGVPQPTTKPMSPEATIKLCVNALLHKAPTSQPSGWPAQFGPGTNGPWLTPALGLIEAANHLKDAALRQRAEKIGRTVMAGHPQRQTAAALRMGGLAEAIQAEIAQARNRIKQQQPDGSWCYEPSITDEQGLGFLYAPPWNKVITPSGTKSQGITAGELAGLFSSVLITNDLAALAAAMKGLDHLDSHAIPFVYRQPECPPSPSLHGAYSALRCHLIAYRITGDKKHLERAVYWARTGLPFIYFWALPAEPVQGGYIPLAEKPRVTAEELYGDSRRQAMLYGGLYGYGSSQFSHHWFGILVQWIALVYADDLMALADYDESLPWRRIADGIVTSAMWLTYDQPPFAGHLPDAFNLDLWTPSGPAIGPHDMLQAILRQYHGWDWRPRTVVVRAEDQRCHVTSTFLPSNAEFTKGNLSFTLNDPQWPHVRAIIAGIGENPQITVDGQPLQRADDLESAEECWSPGPAGLTLLKVRQTTSPRQVAVRF